MPSILRWLSKGGGPSLVKFFSYMKLKAFWWLVVKPIHWPILCTHSCHGPMYGLALERDFSISYGRKFPGWDKNLDAKRPKFTRKNTLLLCPPAILSRAIMTTRSLAPRYYLRRHLVPRSYVLSPMCCNVRSESVAFRATFSDHTLFKINYLTTSPIF